LIVNEVVTAPYDPRFPATNQARHCFVRYNEYYKCVFERGAESERCAFYQRAYESLCPADWVEEWEELREKGLWWVVVGVLVCGVVVSVLVMVIGGWGVARREGMGWLSSRRRVTASTQSSSGLQCRCVEESQG